MTQICQTTHHCPKAVRNYLSSFERCVHLARKDMQVGQIAFLLRRGKGLIRQYLDLLNECESDKNLSYHLQELMLLGTCSDGKKRLQGDKTMSNNTDRLKAGILPLLDKTLENALSRRIPEEFPRIGGPWTCKLCAEMILEVVYNHIRSKESVHLGQVVDGGE